MKKIFAFILATIMVVSLVPASVFAALSNCPKDHNVDNCKYTVVDTVDPTCVDVGYTAYECDACHTQFLGAFVAKLGHDYTVSTADDIHKDSDPDCKTWENGIKWVECARCGAAGDNECNVKECKDADCKLGYIKVAPEHDYVAGVDLGCLTVYTCSKCNDTAYYDAVKKEYSDNVAHNWKFEMTTVEPSYDAQGTAHEGSAQYKCTVCKDIKDVTILAEHTHKLVQVREYKAPLCGVAGEYAKWQCKTCLKYEYRNADDKKVDSKDGVIEALEHTKGERIDDETTCDATYKCGRKDCKGTFTVKEHLKANAVQEEKATCTTYGYKVTYCVACGTSENIITSEPLKHDMGAAVVVTKATCTETGLSTKTCKRSGCGFVDPTVIPVDSTNHDKKTTTTPANASCGTTQIKITVCARNCGMEPVVEVIANEHVKYVASVKKNCAFATSVTNNTTWATETVTKCAKCDWTDRKVEPAATITTSFASEDEANFYHGISYKEGYLDKDGKQQYKYVTRSYSSATHKLTFQVVTTPATCTSNAIGLYTCSHCAVPVYIEVPGTIKAHTPDTTKGTNGVVAYKASTCSKTGNVEHSICKDCGKYFDPTTKATLESVKINKHESNLGSKITVTGTDLDNKEFCTVTSYYKCSCDKLFKNANATGEFKKGDHNWTDIVSGSPVNCNTPGKVQVRRCKDCYRVEGRAVLDGKDKLLGFVIQTKGVKIDLVLDYKLSTDSKADKVIAITDKYALADSKDADLSIPQMEHKNLLTGDDLIVAYTGDADVKNDTCVGVTYKHNICSAAQCPYEYLYNYSATTNGCENSKGDKLTSSCSNHADAKCVYCEKDYNDYANWSSVMEVEATCQNDGYKYQYCLDCGYRKIVEVTFKTPDTHKAVDFKVPASFAGAGYTYSYCEWCEKELSAVKTLDAPKTPGVEILLSTDKATYKPGDFVYVTVSLDSLMGVEVWGANFSVSYNHKVFKYEDFEFCMNDGSLGFNSVNPISSDYYGTKFYDGIVSVAVNTADGVEVKGSFDLVVLKFKVIADPASTAEDEDDTIFGFAVGKVNGSSEDPRITEPNEYSYSVVGVNGIKLESMLNKTNKTEVEIDSFLDLNDDGVTDMADAFQLYYLYTQTEDYIAEADVNCDGDIDDEDIVDLYHILTGVISLADYINPPETTTPVGPTPKA